MHSFEGYAPGDRAEPKIKNDERIVCVKLDSEGSCSSTRRCVLVLQGRRPTGLESGNSSAKGKDVGFRPHLESSWLVVCISQLSFLFLETLHFSKASLKNEGMVRDIPSALRTFASHPPETTPTNLFKMTKAQKANAPVCIPHISLQGLGIDCCSLRVSADPEDTEKRQRRE